MDLSSFHEKRTNPGKYGITYYETQEGILVAKKCTKCNEVKPLGSFSKRKKGSFGLKPDCKDCDKKYHLENLQRRRERSKEWYYQNKDICLSRGKEYRKLNVIKQAEYRQRNKERRANSDREWRKNNKDIVNLKTQQRKARKLNLPHTLTILQQREILRTFNHRCALTEQEGIHLDHVIPLSVGHLGTTFKNMVPLRSDLNMSKQDKNIFEWFERSKERFNLSQAKFDALIEYLAEINEVTPEDYRDHVYWCHENPIDLSEDDVI